MDHLTRDHLPVPLGAYPNLQAAAKMLKVSASTLSRRSDIVVEDRGERDRVLAPSEVLRLAGVYRKRSLNDVAQDLINHAVKDSPDDAMRVEEEVETFFEGRAMSDDRRQDFLAVARRLLPDGLYNEVESAVAEPVAELASAIIGYAPLADEGPAGEEDGPQGELP
jgi:hypothetical protein